MLNDGLTESALQESGVAVLVHCLATEISGPSLASYVFLNTPFIRTKYRLEWNSCADAYARPELMQ
jgi:hypothetical protein